MSNQHQKSPDFPENNVLIEKLDHIKVLASFVGYVVTWKSWWFQLRFSTYNWSILHHRDLSLVSFWSSFDDLSDAIMALEVKENSSWAYPVVLTISKTYSFNFFISHLFTKLLYFPKFQLGTEMGSWDIGETSHFYGSSIGVYDTNHQYVFAPGVWQKDGSVADTILQL